MARIAQSETQDLTLKRIFVVYKLKFRKMKCSFPVCLQNPGLTQVRTNNNRAFVYLQRSHFFYKQSVS